MLTTLHLQPRSLGAIPEATCDTGARVMSLRPDQDWLQQDKGGKQVCPDHMLKQMMTTTYIFIILNTLRYASAS